MRSARSNTRNASATQAKARGASSAKAPTNNTRSALRSNNKKVCLIRLLRAILLIMNLP